MVINTILKLHGGKDDDGDDFLSTSSATVFPAPSFAYFFRLLHQVLYDGGTVVKKDEKNVTRALAILSSHCNLRSSMEEEEESDIIDEVRLSSLLSSTF